MSRTRAFLDRYLTDWRNHRAENRFIFRRFHSFRDRPGGRREHARFRPLAL